MRRWRLRAEAPSMSSIAPPLLAIPFSSVYSLFPCLITLVVAGYRGEFVFAVKLLIGTVISPATAQVVLFPCAEHFSGKVKLPVALK